MGGEKKETNSREFKKAEKKNNKKRRNRGDWGGGNGVLSNPEKEKEKEKRPGRGPLWGTKTEAGKKSFYFQSRIIQSHWKNAWGCVVPRSEGKPRRRN